METQQRMRMINAKSYPLWMAFVFLITVMSGMATAQNFGTPTRYEAENGFNSGVSTSSANAGYSGSGYVTGLHNNNAETKFFKGADQSYPLTRLEIRYANGTGANVTNLALFIGSNQKIQDLVFPPTANWTTWGTITVVFDHNPSWGGDMRIMATTGVATSVNIDYTDVSVSNGTLTQVVAPTFNPVAGTYTSAQSVSLSTTTSGATIYYTTDGSTPTTASTVYSAAINVASTKTVKAIAVKSGMANSSEASASYTISIPPAATPTFSPGAGTYTSAQSVSISTTTTGATIYYTTNGSTPTTSSAVYSTPINVTSTQTVKAIAAKSGMSNSGVASALYTINIPKVATPTFSPVAGTYTSAQSVTISTATTGSTIYYTTNGTTPTTASTVYSGAINVAATQTIKALAVKSGLANSDVATAAYTIDAGTVAPPTFTPVAGTYTSAQSVTLSTTTSGATIYYTTNGSTPTTASSVYSSAINVSATTTVKALAAKSGMTNSSVATALYTINTPPPVPGTFTQTVPASGATAVSRTPAFSWVASSNAASYTLVVSTNSALTSPIINQNVTGTSYTPATQLAATTVYYWRVTAVNATGSTVATNAGISFTTTVAGTGKSAYNTIQAESYNAQSGVVNQTTFIGNLENNDWARYDNIDFGTGVNQFSAYMAVDPGYAGQRIELRLGSATGTLVGTVTTVSTGGFDIYGTQTAPVSGAVGVQTLFLVFKGTEGIGNLESFVFADNTAPRTFTQTAPATGATGVSVTPTFSWSGSSTNATYSLVVSTNSSYSNPAINATGLNATSYTPGAALGGNTLYYWKVTAVNSTGSTIASNAGISFTTLIPPAPGTFTQTSPVGGSTGIARLPEIKWSASTNAASYTLVVSTNSSLASPVINATGLTTTSYTPATALASSTIYYWRVTAINTTASTVASNANLSFTTGTTLGTTYFVSTTGVDSPGNGSAASPFRTVAYAASQVAGGLNNTIFINAGTYTETEPIKLALGVNLQGAGEASTILKSSGVTLAPGIVATHPDYKLWFDGTLIQATSPIYTGTNPKYGSPDQMIPAANGNQAISDFTIDGNSRSLKAGVWVENRNNVTMHHVTIKNCKMRGAVFSRGDMWWYQAMPEGKWMYNTKVYNCTFLNTGADLQDESLGNLCLGGLDGADIYNITVNENQGYGIKFIHVGHFRNMKIHDCNITVPEVDPNWSEDISMELWNFSYNNEIYNITCNTWFSLVNHSQFDDYQPSEAHPSNIMVHNIKMIDQDAVSVKESIECALSGVTIYDSYFQDKGIGIAIWGGTGWGGNVANHNNTVRNNIFANVLRTPTNGFGNNSAVFVPDGAYNIKIYNNIFDRMGNGLQLNGVTSGEVKNNAFINTINVDVEGGSNIVFNNNLKYHTDPAKSNFSFAGGPSLGSGNVTGNPGYLNTGSRWDTYYKPASASSFAVDKGTNVGLPFAGSAPDIGRWEYGSGGRQETIVAEETNDAAVSSFPNPTTGIVKVAGNSTIKLVSVQVLNAQGKTIVTKSSDQLSNSINVDLSEQPNDLYIFKIKHQRGVITKKVVLLK